MPGPIATVSVFLDAVQADARVGLHPEEKLAPQPLELDVALHLDATAGDIRAGGYLDYDGYCNWLAGRLAQEPHTDLLEQLCLRLAEQTFQAFPAVRAITLRAHKAKLRGRARRMGIALSLDRDLLALQPPVPADRNHATLGETS
ncbi:dihydroneopterin aldolase [Bordetella sp. BOR01]|uniref:dihydroneopterin aldolase n=1 Tax=Bordetella sp. BOR01 TaxID=2854779 RepID=UPI001C457208|nr:dihydroneopterin aldolase [Bordetella sp. BOR01]MBV7481817.1 dihydroneopterin aldolase [Bordetella sp. BOR01]